MSDLYVMLNIKQSFLTYLAIGMVGPLSVACESSRKSKTSDINRAKALTTSSENHQRILYTIPCFRETVSKRVETFCGFKVVKQTPDETIYQVVFRDKETKYSGYQYTIGVDSNGQITFHKPYGNISITGAIYCHTFIHSDAFDFYKELGIKS